MKLTRFLIVIVFLIGCSDDNRRTDVQDSEPDAIAQEEAGDHDSRVVDASSNDVDDRDTGIQDSNVKDTGELEEEIIDDLPSGFLVEACQNHPAFEKRCPEEKCSGGEMTNYVPGCPGHEHAHYYHCIPAPDGEEYEWKLYCLCLCGAPL